MLLPYSDELKRLNEILIRYKKTIGAVNSQMVFNDDIADALYVLTLMNASIGFYQENPQAALDPEKELDFLITEAFDKVKDYETVSNQIHSLLYQNILINLANAAISLYDLVPPEKKNFSTIRPILQTLSNYTWPLIDIPSSCSCKTEIDNILVRSGMKKSKNILFSPYELDILMKAASKIDEYKPTLEKVNQQFSQIIADPLSMNHDLLTDQDLHDALIILLNYHYNDTPKNIHFNLKNCISILYRHPQLNKEKFVAIFLTVYQTIYNTETKDRSKKNNKMSTDLFEFFFPMFDKALPAKKLSALISDLINKTSFFFRKFIRYSCGRSL